MPIDLIGDERDEKKEYGPIHICKHCGEKCGKRLYCNFCSTAEGRRKIDIMNRKIRLENEAKGYHYV